ncbi:uncharacterized protein LOC110463614 isoform X2 [Mizuhopecten yessoensis]|uniref:uncharacterized protein LOC110463614 isoform X2 n=1 Tax=Mizuhopecten yessoensis TaxID=6573 RepID=UPI000B45B22F|nr:uncharacterized protein LOC110463614 isoform X2 [Mizuhopecten yessoensis]
MTEKLSWYPLCVIVACLVLPASCEDGPSFCFQNDPCQIALHTLDVYGRSTACPYYGKNGQCDSSLTERWYRVDLPMVTTCPDINSCGTSYPVWLNGTLPTNGTVTRKACMRGYTSCCEKEYTIVLKKCTTFMAYCLQHTTGCAERYCFGSSGFCPVPTISNAPVTLTSISTGVITSISSFTDDNSPPTIFPTPTTPATNTSPGDTPSDPAALVGGTIGGVLALAVICGIIYALWKLYRNLNKSGGGSEKKTRKEKDQNPYCDVRDIVSDSAQYSTVDISTMEAVHTYTGLSQPNQAVDKRKRNPYEVLGSRNPVPMYDQVNTENPQISAPAPRNKHGYRDPQNPVPIYDQVGTGEIPRIPAQTTRNQYEVLGPLNPVPVYDEVNTESQRMTAQSTRIRHDVSRNPVPVNNEVKIDEN